jgi:hypothetical protein
MVARAARLSGQRSGEQSLAGGMFFSAADGKSERGQFKLMKSWLSQALPLSIERIELLLAGESLRRTRVKQNQKA